MIQQSHPINQCKNAQCVRPGQVLSGRARTVQALSRRASTSEEAVSRGYAMPYSPAHQISQPPSLGSRRSSVPTVENATAASANDTEDSELEQGEGRQ